MPLMPVEQAKALVLADATPLGIEKVPVETARGRVLARDLKAKRDQPPFPASAMDGYAVRAADATPGTELRLIGISAAGHGFRRVLEPGEAVRIFTGAPVPEGADAILIQEHAHAGSGIVTPRIQVGPGQFIRTQGLDYRSGEVLLRSGRRLNARDLGLATSMNLSALPVRKKPLVAILATGDELIEPGHRPTRDQIVSSNSAALAAFVDWAGGEPRNLGIVKDDALAIRKAIRKARDADILVTSGGASVGEHDLVKSTLEDAGVALTFWKIAMRPGKPLMFAMRSRQRIIGLPGNPVSSLVCARIFIKPLLDRLLGSPTDNLGLTATLAAPMRANDERQEYARARLLRKEDGSLSVLPFPTQDSSMLRVMVESDCLIVRPPHAPAAQAGDKVEVLPIEF
ncbi:MAG TPA: gephyrin-like molybdotransferase Glp [Aestuariivirgaceae bacterium]|jgi:molybdopterin molybdotransferase